MKFKNVAGFILMVFIVTFYPIILVITLGPDNNPKFLFQQKVKIIDGFYVGQEGFTEDYYGYSKVYTIINSNGKRMSNISEKDLILNE